MAMLHGKIYYAKILGAPQKAYNPGELEWAFDVSIDEATKEKLLSENLPKTKIKNKGDERGDFIQFKRRSITMEGEPAKPYEVVDRKGQPWDQTTLIGNGSEVNVKYLINEWTFNKTKGFKANALAVQVWEHIPYKGREEFPTDDDGNEQWETE